MTHRAFPDETTWAQAQGDAWIVSVLLALLLVVPLVYSGYAGPAPKWIFIGIGAVAVVTRWAVRPLAARAFPGQPLLGPAAAFGAAALLSFAAALVPSLWVRRVVELTALLVISLAAAEVASHGKGRERLVTAMGLSALCVGFIGVAQVELPKIIPRGVAQSQFISLIGNSNWVGGYLAAIIPVLAGAWLEERPGPRRIVLGAAVPFLTVCVAVTNSRAAWLAVIAGLVVVGAAALREGRRHGSPRPASDVALSGLARLAGLGAALGVGLLWISGVDVSDRVKAVFDPTNVSTWIRLSAGIDTLRMVRDHPLLGIGLGNFFDGFSAYNRLADEDRIRMQFIDHPHNEFLALAGELGAVGVLAGLTVVPCLARAARGTFGGRASFGSRGELAGFLGGLAALATNAMGSSPLHVADSALVAATLLGLVAGLTAEVGAAHARVPSNGRLIRVRVGLGLSLVFALAVALYDVRPAVVAYLVGQGKAELSQGRLADARETLARARHWFPADAYAGFYLVETLNRLRQYQAAAEVGSVVMAERPALLMVYSMTGGAQIWQRAFAEAEQTFRLALARNPWFTNALLNLGGLAINRGDPSAAVALLERARDISPGSGAVHLSLGTAYARSGRWPDAMRALARASVLGPGVADAWYGLAVARVMVGERAGAIEALIKAVSLDGSYRAAARQEAAFVPLRTDARFAQVVGGS